MIDLNNLIDLLPSYFKDRDTYKDSNNKGLLEKFLNICGSYFKDKPLIDLGEFLDAHNPEKVDDLYINYIWEFLGEFPFLQSVFYNQEAFLNTFDGFNLAKAKTASRVEPKNLLKITQSEYSIREILPYVIKLYQIRGTKTFFDVVFRLYNLSPYIKQVDTYEGLSADAKSILPRDIYGKGNSYYVSNYEPQLDGDETFDQSSNQYDGYLKCNTCMTLFFEVRVPSLSTEDESFYISAVVNLINKFVPYYIKPVVVFPEKKADYKAVGSFRVQGVTDLVQGVIPPEVNYTDVNGSPVTRDPQKFPLATNHQVVVEARVITSPLALKGYIVGYQSSSTSPISWNSEVHTDSLYLITKPGIYCFKPLGSTNNDITKISVGSIDISFKYFLYGDSDNTGSLGNLGDTLQVKVKGGGIYTSLYQNPEGNKVISNLYKYTPEDVLLVSQPKDPNVNVVDNGPEGINHKFTLNWPGEYDFQLRTNPSNTYKLRVLSSDQFEEDLKTSTLTVEPLTLYVRGGDYNKGTKSYSSTSFYDVGVKGVYELKGNTYVPHDYSISLEALDGFGNPQPIVISDDLGSNKTYNPDSNGEYGFNLPKDNRNQVYNISTEGSSSVTVRVIMVEDPVQLDASPKSLNINPNKEGGTYEARTDNSLTLTVKAIIDIASGHIDQVQQYAPYVFITTQSTYNNNTEQVLNGSLVGQEFRDSGGKLMGYLVRLSYASGGANSNDPATYNHSGITVNLKTLLGTGHTSGTVIARLVTTEVNSSGGIKYKLRSVTDYNSNQTTLYFVLPSITNYGFFGLPSQDHWSSLSGGSLPPSITSGGDFYTSGRYGFSSENDMITDSTFDIYPLVASIMNSSELINSNLVLKLNNSEVDSQDLYEGSPVPLTLDFLSLTESSKTYKFDLYDGNTVINNRGFTITLFAPALVADIEVLTPEYSISSDSNGKYLPITFGDNTNIAIDFKVKSNRTKPPYKVHYGSSSTITTSSGGTFTLQLDPTSNGTEVWVDLQDDGANTLGIDPSFRIKVIGSTEPDPVDPKDGIDISPSSLSWSTSEEGKTKTLNINIKDQTTLDSIDHIEITEQ